VDIPQLSTNRFPDDPTNLHSQSYYRDQQIRSFQAQYSRFKWAHLLIQFITFVAFLSRVIRTYQVLSADSDLPVSGNYNLYDDVRSWVQMLIVTYFLYYAWIPFPLTSYCFLPCFRRRPERKMTDDVSIDSEEEGGEVLDHHYIGVNGDSRYMDKLMVQG